MNIEIEQLPKDYRNDVIRLGGVPTYYEELDECFMATFDHHTIHIEGDCAVIIDDLTGDSIVFERSDFYSIEIM